jgi:hypothetical protein
MSSRFLKQPLVLVFFGGKKSISKSQNLLFFNVLGIKTSFRSRFFENFQRTNRSHERTPQRTDGLGYRFFDLGSLLF